MACRVLFAGLIVLVACGSSLAANSVLASAGKAREQVLEAAWGEELSPQSPETKVVAYETPIKRVVSLLEKMRTELMKEGSDEADMYDRMVCWCGTNEKDKTQSVKRLDALDKELVAEGETRSALFGTHATEIARLKEQISADTEALKTATAIREKEAGEFRGEESDLVVWITNVKNAIAVLSRHQASGASFVQLDGPVFSSMQTVLRDLALNYEMMLAGKPHGKARIAALISLGVKSDRSSDRAAQDVSSVLLNALGADEAEASDALPVQFAEKVLMKESSRAAQVNGAATGFLQADVHQPYYQSYSTRSDVIFGILKQMQEEFESDLSQEQKDELNAVNDHQALAKAKEEQIAVAKEKLDTLEGEHADNQKALSDANENLQLARDQRSADIEFLRNLKLTCNDLDHEWQLRSKTRSQEIAAVAEAIAILTKDDHMDLLRDTIAFLQEQQRTHTATGAEARALRSRVAASLRRASTEPAFQADDLLTAWHNRRTETTVGAGGGPRAQLSTLAVTVQLDSFTKVKAMMDKMVEDLKEEQEEEVKFKAFCVKDLSENEKATYAKTEEKEDLEAKIARQSALISKLQDDIKDAKAQIATTEVEIQKASQNRERENAEFQTTVADQRATQDILKKALLRLKAFYNSAKGGKGPSVLLERAVQTPPEKFNDYKTNANASPVIGLIEQIVSDSKQLEEESVAAETSAQANYVAFVKDSNSMIAELSQSITQKTKLTAATTMEQETAKSGHGSAVTELESLAQTNADLHAQCDFVLKNFKIRQRARLQEIEAIQGAKAILSGKK